MRKLFCVCAASLLMSPISAWSLGMGDIRVSSRLNQPLRAEIELHSVSKKNLDQLRVQLASKKLFSRSDIEYSTYLAQLEFKLIRRHGKSFVAVTTEKPFRVPFANFLVETRWGSGQLFREYTILLDPPEFIAKHARPPVSARLANNSKAPVKHYNAPENTILRPNSIASSGLSSGGRLVKASDTLWKLAKEMAPQGVSIEQMMMALLRDNPEAFADNNINNLKTGYVLRIKDPSTLRKMTRSMARQQVREQYASWKEARKQSKMGNIVDRSSTPPAEVKHDGKLFLLASGDTQKSGVIKENFDTKARSKKQKLAIVNESLNSKRLENLELKHRVEELEKMIKTQDSLIVLKDRSLAILQQQYKSKKKDGSKLPSEAIDKQGQETTDPLAETEINAVAPLGKSSGQ